MISANELRAIVTVLTENGINAFRYKNGDEELELVVSPSVTKTEPAANNDTAEPEKTYMGFQVKSFSDIDEE